MARRGRNEGSISRRSDGIYRAQFSLPGGKRISASFARKEEAIRWISEQRMKVDRGFDFKGSKITLADYLPQWLETNSGSLRLKTVQNYRQVINKHIVPGIGHIALKDLRLITIEGFYSSMVQDGIGVRTVRVCHNILHKALEKAVRYGLVLFNPSNGAELPRYHHEEMHVLDETQVSQFLVAAQNSPYCALYYLAVTSGMRQGELFGLKWDDLQWTRGVLHVQRQVQTVPGEGWSFVEPKTKAGKRTITLGESTLLIMRQHKQRQEQIRERANDRWQEYGLIFPSARGTPGDPSNLRVDFNRTLNQAGIPRIRFHDLRHTAASLMLNHNVPVIVVSKILGHSKPSITLDIYGHLYTEMQGEAASIMDGLVTPIGVQLPQQPVKRNNSLKR